MLYLIIAAAAILLDQISKHYLTLLVKDGSVRLIPGIIRLVYVENTGAAFSMFSSMRWALVATSIVAIAGILAILFRFSRHFGKPACYALSLVLGGAVGNLIDRVLFGYVADFFEFEFVRFAVFNVADIFITVGGIAFIIFYLLHPTGDASKKKATAGEAPDAVTVTEGLAQETIESPEDGAAENRIASESGAPENIAVSESGETENPALPNSDMAENTAAPEHGAPDLQTEPDNDAED
ncbi:MAG TPA: signal peptidase II [Papillibacter sp.]|jgi:signal peptidase II|nr:signal peptidase II [Papillibacter sp.]